MRCLKGFYIELELFVLSYEIHKFITAVVLRKKQSYPKIIQYKSYCGEAAGLAFFSVSIVRVSIPLFLASELFGFFAFSYFLLNFRECNGSVRCCDVVEWKRPLNLITPLLHR